MAPQQLAALYKDLQRNFDARPSDLKKCGSLLAQLKVGSYTLFKLLYLNGLSDWLDRSWVITSRRGAKARRSCRCSYVCNSYSLVYYRPQNVGDILEIGAFWSIRSKDVPSFDRYFSQLQTFYTDYR